MQMLAIETPSPFIVRPGAATVALVGCGGTGSHIAQTLARLAVHLEAAGQPLRLYFIDGDEVEEKNVGRQMFTPGDVGQNKAMVLAERFNRLFGLRIKAVPKMATLELLRKVRLGDDPTYDDALSLMIGAVDNAVARKSLHGALAEQVFGIWLDCGNHDYAGQVSLGTTTRAEVLKHAVRLGLCTNLPAPSLIDPEILEAADRRRVANCAIDVAANLQGLMVNTQVAAIAAVYLDRLLIHRQISFFRTSFAQQAMSMRSVPITERTVAEVAQSYQRYTQQRRAEKIGQAQMEIAA